ncbi:MAG: SDR family oxidoreductase [Pseudomonadota bacterium]
MSLTGRVILVTGAGGTLGRAICAAIAALGGVPVATDLTPGPGIDYPHDVTSEADWQRVITAIDGDHGCLDGVVNNAGVMLVAGLADTSFAAWRRVMAVNADGTFLGCRMAWDLLQRGEAPSIVNMCSVSGIVGGAKLSAYNASKGAVRLLTKSVALEGARLTPPIRCNSVHPAFVEGSMVDGIAAAMRDPTAAHEKMRTMVPLGRFCQAEEVATTVVTLLSPVSAFITGTEVVIDGGLTAA